jgi:nucleoside diphosphate kinase
MKPNFPDHTIDPAKKDSAWRLQFMKAAWDEFTTSGIKMFYGARTSQQDEYAEIMDYMLGRQSTDKYKKTLLGDEAADESWMNVDFSVRPVAAKLIDIGISKILQRGFNIVATPIDLLAKDEKETYYAEHKARIRMREEMLKVNPALANEPAFMKQEGHPEDLEELEMMMEVGPKLKVAMEAEMGITYVFYKNEYLKQLFEIIRNLWAFGPGGAKEYVDENGEVVIRPVDPSSLIVSYCNKPDFSDARYIGEVIEVSVGSLPFDKETRQDICYQANAKNNVYDSRYRWGHSFDREKVQVLDIEFVTDNDRIYEKRQNKFGNIVSRRTSYDNKGKSTKTVINGKEKDKYSNRPVQVIYKGKWIIGTDYIYDDGPATYQKRTKPNKALTSFSYHLYAANFYKMRSSGMMKRLIPIIDEYHCTLYKVQNFKNKWIPYVINIDIQAMENVALGANNANLTEIEILDLVMQNYVALGRRMDVSGQLQNYKMVDIENTGMHQEFSVLAGDLARLYNEMRDVVGLNDITDGSTPGERTLNGVANLAADATNNALYPIITASKNITESLAKGVILRLMQTVKDRELSGVVRTLGSETVKFIRVTKDICERIIDVKLEDKPTQAQKDMLIQQMSIKENQGLITPEDVIMIMNTDNLKQAQVLLAYRIKKRRKEMEQQKLIEIRENGRTQQESAKVAEEEKRRTLTLEYKLKTDYEITRIDKMKELEVVKNEGKLEQVDTTVGGKLLAEQMKGDSKTALQTAV